MQSQDTTSAFVCQSISFIEFYWRGLEICKGLRTGQVHEPILSTEQIATWVEHDRIGAVELMDAAR